MFWLVLNNVAIYLHEKLQKHCMYRFCGCKYSLNLFFIKETRV